MGGSNLHHSIPIQRSIFECNTIIRNCISKPHQSLSVYLHSLLPSLAIPNKITFIFLLKSFSFLKTCYHFYHHYLLRLLHSHIIKFNLGSDPFLCSSLISAYANYNQISTVRLLFTHCPYKDTVVRTALVSAFAKWAMPHDAQKAFDEMPDPNPISWGALILAYEKADRHAEALSVFFRMRIANVGPTEACLVSALAASAGLCNVRGGQRMHMLVTVQMGRLTASLGTALLSMYAKCGLVEDSLKVFDEICERDRASWTAMISSIAAHGRGESALRLFNDMLMHGIIPDHVTYVAILHACSGMVDEAKYHFETMQRVYGIEARAQHYGCMVDILGRGGRVEEAWELVRSVPREPDLYVLKSLMNACCEFGFIDGAEWAAERLRRIDVGDASSYVMLANLYAGLGRWQDSARVWRSMRDRGVPKMPGSSTIG